MFPELVESGTYGPDYHWPNAHNGYWSGMLHDPGEE